ncbi:MAG: ornithine cyclodeaminase family protein [Acidobacteriaceae bacterium]
MTTPVDRPLWISEAEVVSMMDIGGAIGALERGLMAEAEGNAQNMIKTHVEWDGSTLHAIGAVFPRMGICGTKTWSHTPSGATPLLILFDSNHGNLMAVIEAFALGQMRTAAASGVATRWLAAAEADEFAMIGAGKQAITQVAAVLAVRPIRRIRVFSRDENRRNQFVARLRAEFEVEAVASRTVREAVDGASIISVATRATDPIVTADLVQPGAHINSVGAIVPSRAEISQDVLARSTRIVTDSISQAHKLSREMIEFFGNDSARWNAVQPLATVVANRLSRSASDDLTLFKALGVGISDLSLGIELYRKALASGLGHRFSAPQRISPRLGGEVK